MLADMAMKLEAARAPVYATARYIDTRPKERPTLYAAMARCFSSDVAMEVTTDGVQVSGQTPHLFPEASFTWEAANRPTILH
jgi:alkylation response protein AidB-like acyl-CoA dehydrogenase